MNKIFFDYNFAFRHIQTKSFRYIDNRRGSPRNFLAYLLKGHAKIVSNRKTIEAKEGEVFFIPKALSYQSYWYGNDEISFLSFGFSELHTTENTKYELQVIPCDAEVVEKIIRIPTKGINVDCEALSLFYAAMAEVIPCLKHSAENREETMVNNIMHCIRKHPHSPLSEIASMCAISEPYLYTLFKKVTHITPNHYRQEVLCKAGIELLMTTDKKVEEISEILNFSSSSYFRKVLKKHTGSTPREIRKNQAL